MLAVFSQGLFAQEARRVKLTGEKADWFKLGDLTDVGAVGIMERPDSEEVDIDILGEDSSLDRISGYNHNLDKTTAAGGHRPAIVTELSEAEVNVDDPDLSLYGVPYTEVYNTDHVSLLDYVEQYAPHADVTVTGNGLQKWGTDDSIGGPDDYKIVYVHNGKLQLEDNFTGYGVLVIFDDHPGAGMAELRMADNATWYGPIICYADDTPGKSDKLFLKFGNESGFGLGWKKGGEFFKTMLAKIGLVTPEAYADSKGKGGGGETTEPGSGVTVLGSVLVETRQVDIKLDLADIYYCSETLDAIDNMMGQKGVGEFEWEDWQETE
jgi:hypothetical protein